MYVCLCVYVRTHTYTHTHTYIFSLQGASDISPNYPQMSVGIFVLLIMPSKLCTRRKDQFGNNTGLSDPQSENISPYHMLLAAI